MTGVRVTRLPKHTVVIQQRFCGRLDGIFCYLLIYTHHSPGPQVRPSGDRTHTAALSTRERPASNLHHYSSSRGQNSLPSIPPHAPKLPSKNDQLPELGATGRNRKIRPNRWLLNASRAEMAVELSLVLCGMLCLLCLSKPETGSHQIFKLSSKLKSIKVTAWQNRDLRSSRGLRMILNSWICTGPSLWHGLFRSLSYAH